MSIDNSQNSPDLAPKSGNLSAMLPDNSKNSPDLAPKSGNLAAMLPDNLKNSPDLAAMSGEGIKKIWQKTIKNHFLSRVKTITFPNRSDIP
jgi:hypothetical protein